MRVLTDVQRRIQRECARSPCQQHVSQQGSERDNVSSPVTHLWLLQAPFLPNLERRAGGDFAYATEAGMVSSTSVPELSSLHTASFPATALARSCMPAKP